MDAQPELPFACPQDRFGLTKVALSEVNLQVACRGSAGPVFVMPEATLNWYRANLSSDLTTKMPSGVTIDEPTLVLWGEADSYVTTSELQYIPQYVSDLKIQTFPGVDHWLTHQVMDKLANAIMEFEKGLP